MKTTIDDDQIRSQTIDEVTGVTSLRTIDEVLQRLASTPLIVKPVKPIKHKQEVVKKKKNNGNQSKRQARERATLKGQWREMKKWTGYRERWYRRRKDIVRAEASALAISLLDWIELWHSIGPLPNDQGTMLPAWQLRGRDKSWDVQLRRKDKTKPWTLENVDILYKNKSVLQSTT